MNRSRGNLLRWFKPTLVVVGILVFLVAMIEIRAQRALDAARNAVREQRIETALTLYARSLNWYLPFGASEIAARELVILGKGLAEKGQTQEALVAFERMRAGLNGARSFYVPRMDLVGKVEPLMARLRAEEKLGPRASTEDLSRKTDEYLALYERPARPQTGPGLAASVGFLVWAVGVLWFIFRGFTATGFQWSRVWPALGCAFIGLLAWFWGMVWA